MGNLSLKIFFLILTARLGRMVCPPYTVIGKCNFRVHCIGEIQGVNLPVSCQGSINYPVSVDLTVTNAIEKFDSNLINTDFFNVVTSFKVSGKWPETQLSVLEYTPRLKKLNLVNNEIKHIAGSPFFRLKHLEEIDLSHNFLSNIEELFLFETKPQMLHKLSLAHNDIQELNNYAFDDLESLKELDLSYNFLSDLADEPFLNLTNLLSLRLNNNRIKDLNGALNDLKNLKHLYLRGNQLQNINVESLQIIYHLETFDVSDNQLDKLRPIVFLRHWNHFQGKSMCKIILSDNHITLIPNATSEISSRFTRDLTTKLMRENSVDVLTELDLSKNMITDIQYNAFQSIIKLISLDLSSNKLINFIINAEDLQYVKYLNLSKNYLTTLYFTSFYTMTNLEHLDLSYNNLAYIPEGTFNNNYNLKVVNMTHNVMKHLGQINIHIFHSDGGLLDFSDNSLSEFKISLGEGRRLTVLILKSNNITNVGLINLYYQNELRILDLSYNYIQELNGTSLHLPVNLIYLQLSHNQINTIHPSTFKHMRYLKSLILSHNKLENIEYGAFQGLTTLSNLDLSYNNIRQLDSRAFIDLKQLSVLSLKYNGIYSLDYKIWLGLKIHLRIYVEGNKFSCDWLGTALTNFNNGYSNMKLAVEHPTTVGHSIEGIPCVPKEIGELIIPDSRAVMVDERLLLTSQKILETVKEQTRILHKYLDIAMKSKYGTFHNTIEKL